MTPTLIQTFYMYIDQYHHNLAVQIKTFVTGYNSYKKNNLLCRSTKQNELVKKFLFISKSKIRIRI